jgi:hypothetical protein
MSSLPMQRLCAVCNSHVRHWELVSAATPRATAQCMRHWHDLICSTSPGAAGSGAAWGMLMWYTGCITEVGWCRLHEAEAYHQSAVGSQHNAEHVANGSSRTGCRGQGDAGCHEGAGVAARDVPLPFQLRERNNENDDGMLYWRRRRARVSISLNRTIKSACGTTGSGWTLYVMTEVVAFNASASLAFAHHASCPTMSSPGAVVPAGWIGQQCVDCGDSSSIVPLDSQAPSPFVNVISKLLSCQLTSA